MAAVGLLDDVGVQRVDVVGAQQPEVLGAREGEVEQRLVALALDELVGAALRPDRLADAPQPAPLSGVGVDELAPGGDDARGVGADVGHDGERHALGLGSELVAQAGDPGGADDDEDRLAGRDRVADPGERPLQEAVIARVEQRLVTEPVRRPARDVLCGRCHRFPKEGGHHPPVDGC
jgi:hypothetical protein